VPVVLCRNHAAPLHDSRTPEVPTRAELIDFWAERRSRIVWLSRNAGRAPGAAPRSRPSSRYFCLSARASSSRNDRGDLVGAGRAAARERSFSITRTVASGGAGAQATTSRVGDVRRR